MKIISPSLFAFLLLLSAAGTAVSQTPIKARTESGKEVILSPDGTWKYVTDSAPHSHSSSEMTKPAGAKSVYRPSHGNFGIWYDETKWTKAPQEDTEGRVEFKLKRGDAFAIVIVEEIGVPIDTLKEVALENAKSAAPDAKIIFEENRKVNGKEVLCMKIDGTIKGIPFRYFGYYYGGKRGSIQLLTFTGQEIFAKYEQEFEEFLNGLEIVEQKP